MTRGRLRAHDNVEVVAATSLTSRRRNCSRRAARARRTWPAATCRTTSPSPSSDGCSRPSRPPERIVVMVQREVARAHGRRRGPGVAAVARRSAPTEGRSRSSRCPRLHSGRRRRCTPPLCASSVLGCRCSIWSASAARFFHLLRAGFAEPRKQLHNTLRQLARLPERHDDALLDEAGIDATKRAQHIGLDDWRRLFDADRRAAPRGARCRLTTQRDSGCWHRRRSTSRSRS